MINEASVLEIINKTLDKSFDLATTPLDQPLESLGIDSLDFYTLLVELETSVGRKVPDDVLPKLQTIHALADFFK